MIPYANKVVSDYLRTHAAVAAITNRVVAKPPHSTETPWVQVRQLDATNAAASIPEHLIDFLLQFDCYADEAGGQPQAITLGRTVRQALVDMPGVRGGVTVSAVQITGDADVPDIDLRSNAGAPRDRKVLTATVWMHN